MTTETLHDQDALRLQEYKLLARYQHCEAAAFWRRHGLYLIVSALLLAALALTASGQNASRLTRTLCLGGLFVSLAWVATVISGYLWCFWWDREMLQAEQEFSLPGEPVGDVLPPVSSPRGLLLRLVSVRLWSGVLSLLFLGLWVTLLYPPPRPSPALTGPPAAAPTIVSEDRTPLPAAAAPASPATAPAVAKPKKKSRPGFIYVEGRHGDPFRQRRR